MDLPSKIFGNYRIDRVLGEGGMGAVYRAYDLSRQRAVMTFERGLSGKRA
jgi:serine/threonine protein kinase